MKSMIKLFLVALLAPIIALAQDNISQSTGIIGNGRLLGAKTYDGQVTVGVLGVDSSGNTTIQSLSGKSVSVPGTMAITGDATLTGNVVLATSAKGLFTDTVDAADDQIIDLSAASAIGVTRGAALRLGGNESSIAGKARLVGGQVSTGDIEIYTNHASASTIISGGNAGVVQTNNATGLVLAAGKTLTSVATSDIGWAAVAGANTACNTTCTSGCVFGFDAGTTALVSCASALADTCVCAGAS